MDILLIISHSLVLEVVRVRERSSPFSLELGLGIRVRLGSYSSRFNSSLLLLLPSIDDCYTLVLLSIPILLL